MRFDTTIPSGAPTCHFTLWKADGEEKDAWQKLTRKLDEKAIEIAKRKLPLQG